MTPKNALVTTSGPHSQSTPTHSADAPLTAIRAAAEQKGLDIRALDLHSRSDVADCFVLVSGTSDRHVKGLADRIEHALKLVGETPASRSGDENCRWIILDYGNFVVHVFQQESRQYYNLDELWKGAEPVPLPGDLNDEVKRSRTGLMG